MVDLCLGFLCSFLSVHLGLRKLPSHINEAQRSPLAHRVSGNSSKLNNTPFEPEHPMAGKKEDSKLLMQAHDPHPDHRNA